MKSSPFIGLIACIIAMGIFLIPSNIKRIEAIPENLWSSDGAWHKPSASHDILKWDRKEYGVHWTWLVYDSEAGGGAWYAKVSPPHLTIHIFISIALGCMAGILSSRHSKAAEKRPD